MAHTNKDVLDFLVDLAAAIKDGTTKTNKTRLIKFWDAWKKEHQGVRCQHCEGSRGCNQPAQFNGYCFRHRADGQSMSQLQEKEEKDIQELCSWWSSRCQV